MEKFTLTISLGNDAMRRKRHVAGALQEVAKRLLLSAFSKDNSLEGKVHDLNGNTVGEWKLQ